MPILDSVKKQYKRLNLSRNQQRVFTERLVHNFSALQQGYQHLFGSTDENDLLRLIYKLLDKSQKYSGLRPYKFSRKSIAYRTNRKSPSDIAEKTLDHLISQGFELCFLDATGSDRKCSFYQMPPEEPDPMDMVNKVFSGNPVIYLNFHIYQKDFHRTAEFIYACKQIIQPNIHIIVNPLPGSGWLYYTNKTWYHHQEADTVVNELFAAACWDAIATRHTRILKSSLERIINEERLSINTIDPGYLTFTIDNEDIYMAGYTPEGHHKFLRDFYTYNFPGTMSSMSLVFKDGIDVFQGDIAMLSGFKKANELKDKIWKELSFLRIRLLEGLMLMMKGIPILTDTPAFPLLNSQVWEFRNVLLSKVGSGAHKPEIIPYDDPQVLGLEVRVGRKRYRCWYNFVPEKREIFDKKSVASLRKQDKKDILGQSVSIKKDHFSLEAYGLAII